MRKLSGLAAALIVAAVVAPAATTARQDQIDPAHTLLADARAALGGADRLAAIKSLVLKGQVKNRYSGHTGNADSDFAQFDDELKILLPDNVLEHEHQTDMLSPDRYTGYAGDVLLSHWGPPPSKNWKVAGSWSPVAVENERYAVLILTLLLRGDTASLFTFVDSTADTLVFKGAGARIPDVRIEIDPATHLPRRAKYDMVGQPSRGAAPPSRISVVLEISDYRTEGGFQLAHRFEWYELGLLQNVRVLQSVDLDASLTPADFVKASASR